MQCHTSAEIWTQALANYAEFIGKEVWLNPNEPTEIILVIRWVTRLWKWISREQLKVIELAQ